MSIAGTAMAAAGEITPFTPYEGVEYNGTVAQFIGITAPPIFTDIDWGDGTHAAGTLSAGGANEYFLSGQHTYASPGQVAVTAGLYWDDQFTQAGPASITVLDAPLDPSPIDFTAQLGVEYNGLVGYFTDRNPSETLDDISGGVIDWGDGTESPARIDLDRGRFRVFGQHTYQLAGIFPVNVHVFSKEGGSTTIASTARVPGHPHPVFTVRPATPCAEQTVSFDASRTTFSPGTKAASYEWSFFNPRTEKVEQLKKTDKPVLKTSFPYSREIYNLPLDGSQDFPDVKYERDPIAAKLTVTDSAGGERSRIKRIRFADNGFRPTPEHPHADCGGSLIASAFKPAGNVHLVRPGSSGSFDLSIYCKKIVDCVMQAVVVTKGGGKPLAAGGKVIRAGHTDRFQVKLTQRGRRTLAQHHRVKAKLLLRSFNAGGVAHALRQRIVLVG